MNLAAQQCLDNAGAIRACARDDTTTTPSTASATVSGHRGMGRGGLEPVAPRNPGRCRSVSRMGAPGLATRIGVVGCQTRRLTAKLAGSVLASATVRRVQSRDPVVSAGTACIWSRGCLASHCVCLAHLRCPSDRVQGMPSVSRLARMDRTVDCQLRGGSDQHPSLYHGCPCGSCWCLRRPTAAAESSGLAGRVDDEVCRDPPSCPRGVEPGASDEPLLPRSQADSRAGPATWSDSAAVCGVADVS